MSGYNENLKVLKICFILFPLKMQLLKLRYYQLKRDLGIWIFIITGTVFWFCLEFTSDRPTYGYSMAGVTATLIYAYHSNRKDRNFIRFYLKQPISQILLNYNISVLPISASLIYNKNTIAAITLHVVISFVSLFELKFSGRKLFFINRFIPSDQFEWISGLRNNFYLIIVLSLLAIFLSPVKLFGLAALFLLNTIFLSFYNLNEPLIMLNPTFLSSEKFLSQKINFLFKMILITNSPLLIVNAFFQPDSIWFSALFLVGLLILASCTVYLKYANYQPGESQSFHIDQLILFAGLFLPYLLFLSAYLYFHNRKKAILQLNLLLYDQDSDTKL